MIEAPGDVFVLDFERFFPLPLEYEQRFIEGSPELTLRANVAGHLGLVPVACWRRREQAAVEPHRRRDRQVLGQEAAALEAAVELGLVGQDGVGGVAHGPFGVRAALQRSVHGEERGTPQIFRRSRLGNLYTRKYFFQE